MRNGIISWALTAATALAVVSGPTGAMADDLTIASYGGRMQDNQRTEYFDPFTQQTGIRIIDTTGISLAKVQAMVTTGNVEWDLFLASHEELVAFAEEGLLEEIDYSKIDKAVVAELDPRVVHSHGVGSQFYGAVIAFNTRRFPAGEQPQSWADVWDAEKFPGPRILPAATYQLKPIEPALIAAGVAPDALYPLDLDRAYESLSKIRGNVVKWVSSGNAAPQGLVDGEADIAIANHARIAQLRDEGAPVDYTWNQGVITASFWAIPKGAKNYEAALKFIEFASRSERQLAFASKMPYGPANTVAAKNLPAELQRDNPVAPENAEKVVFMDAASWSAKGADGVSILERNVEMWNNWLRQ